MKLIICLFLFVLFLLTLLKIDYREHFTNDTEIVSIRELNFKKCKNVFKNDEKMIEYLKSINNKLEGIDCFIPILFLVIRNLLKKINKILEELIKQKNLLVSYYNSLLKNGSANKFQKIDDSFQPDNSPIKFTDFDKFDEDNGIFSFSNYIDDIELVIDGKKTKLSGNSYNQLKNDIKKNYKVKEITDRVLLTVMFNYLIEIYNKCESLESKIKELIDLIETTTTIVTTVKENFSNIKLDKIKISKKNKKFLVVDFEKNSELVKHIWKNVCKLSNNIEFDVKKFDKEIKNLII